MREGLVEAVVPVRMEMGKGNVWGQWGWWTVVFTKQEGVETTANNAGVGWPNRTGRCLDQSLLGSARE